MTDEPGRGGWLASLWSGFKSMLRACSIILTVVMLLGLFRTYVPVSQLRPILRGNEALGVIIGTGVGSIATGNAITSYIIGGELLTQGTGLQTVTAFIVAWVTVGIIQLPAESAMLGRRFAVARNLSSAVLTIIVSLVTVWTVAILP